MVVVQMSAGVAELMRHEPLAVEMKSGMMFIGRIWSGERLSEWKTIRQWSAVGCQLSVVSCP